MRYLLGVAQLSNMLLCLADEQLLLQCSASCSGGAQRREVRLCCSQALVGGVQVAIDISISMRLHLETALQCLQQYSGMKCINEREHGSAFDESATAASEAMRLKP